MKYLATSFVILVLGMLGVLAPLKDAFVTVTAPLQFGLRKFAFNLHSSARLFGNLNKIRQENLDFITKSQRLENQILELKVLREENELLKKQLGLNNIVAVDQKIILADVLGNPNDAGGSSIFVSKGSRDGIRPNDTLIIGKYLVGIIRNVEFSRSRAELIISPELAFTVYDVDSQDKASGLAKGQQALLISMDRILPNEKVLVGDTIVTSGKDGIFGPNLIVGKVVEVQSDPSQPLKKALIKPEIDFSSMFQVFILMSDN